MRVCNPLSLLLACTTFVSAFDFSIAKNTPIAPQLSELAPQLRSFAPTSKRIKARYGPFDVPSKLKPTLEAIFTKEAGLKYFKFNILLPCKNCYILGAEASAEYENGTTANLNNGISLHHFTTYVVGKGRHSTPCTVTPGELLFSAGNERSPSYFGDVVEKKFMSAFPITEKDTFPVNLAFQNLNDQDVKLYTTLTLEFVEGAMPKDWLRQRSVWMDNGNCTALPSVKVPKDTTKFYLQSKKWVADVDGEILGAGGHIHSGGYLVEIYQNDKVVCESRATYEQSAMGHSMRSRRDHQGSMVKRHEPENAKEGSWYIKGMSTCAQMGKVRKGDAFYKRSHYDLEKYHGMKNKDGSWMDVEGVAVMSLALNQAGK